MQFNLTQTTNIQNTTHALELRMRCNVGFGVFAGVGNAGSAFGYCPSFDIENQPEHGIKLGLYLSDDRQQLKIQQSGSGVFRSRNCRKQKSFTRELRSGFDADFPGRFSKKPLLLFCSLTIWLNFIRLLTGAQRKDKISPMHLWKRRKDKGESIYKLQP